MSKFALRLSDDEKPLLGADKPKPMKPRDAATLILIRGGREVMLGQRSAGHVFMPDKWVFPGGRVEPGDAKLPAARELSAETESLLRQGGARRPPRAYALAAVRETREEAGMVLGGADGPDLTQLAFICRAVTPPQRSRRFDARFFMADAEAVQAHGEPAAGDQELLHTKWFSFSEAEALDLPTITRFVLKEARARLAGETLGPPFLRWRRGAHDMERLAAGG
jgi:8-oxo-dGTP pyrophosphatase MutT (NUDIX family)